MSSKPKAGRKAKSRVSTKSKPASIGRAGGAKRLASGSKPGAKKKGAKKAVAAEAEAEATAEAAERAAAAELERSLPEDDPWSKYESAWGGPMTPADEWKRISGGMLGRRAVVTRAMLGDRRAAAPVSTTELDAALKAAGALPVSEVGTVEEVDEEGAADARNGAAGGAGGTVHSPGDLEQLEIRSCDVTALSLPRAARAWMVALDLTDNRLTSDAVERLEPNYVRVLNLTGNSLTRVPSLDTSAFIVQLDLSYNSLAPLSVTMFEPLAERLRSLDLSCCGIESLMEGRVLCLSPLSALEVLSIASNNLADPRDLKEVGSLKRLTRLDEFNNPWSKAEGYDDALAAAKRKLSSLRLFNGVDATAKFTSGIGASTLADALERSTVASGGGDDSASCSCVEGNPCAVPYNCRSWDNRFDVARKAREEKYDTVCELNFRSPQNVPVRNLHRPSSTT